MSVPATTTRDVTPSVRFLSVCWIGTRYSGPRHRLGPDPDPKDENSSFGRFVSSRGGKGGLGVLFPRMSVCSSPKDISVYKRKEGHEETRKLDRSVERVLLFTPLRKSFYQNGREVGKP